MDFVADCNIRQHFQKDNLCSKVFYAASIPCPPCPLSGCSLQVWRQEGVDSFPTPFPAWMAGSQCGDKGWKGGDLLSLLMTGPRGSCDDFCIPSPIYPASCLLPRRTELGHQFLPGAIPLAPFQPGLGSPRILLSGRVHISVLAASRSEGSFATFRAHPLSTNGVLEPLPLPFSLFSWPWQPTCFM